MRTISSMTPPPQPQAPSSSRRHDDQHPRRRHHHHHHQKQHQELLAIASLHKEALVYLEEENNLDAARGCFNTVFTTVTRLLRETPPSNLNHHNRDDVFYFRGSPLVRESSMSPVFSSAQRSTRTSRTNHPAGTAATTSSSSSSSSSSGRGAKNDDDDDSEVFALPTTAAAATTTSSSTTSRSSSTSSSSNKSRPSPFHGGNGDAEDDDDEDFLPIFHRALHLPKLATINHFVFCTLYNLALSTHLSALAAAEQEDNQEEQEDASSSGSSSASSPSSSPPIPISMILMRRAAKQWGLVYALQWRKGLNIRADHGLAILLNLGHAKSWATAAAAAAAGGGGDAKADAGAKAGVDHDSLSESSKICYQNILSAIQILDSRNQNVPHKAFYLYNAFRMLANTGGRGGGRRRHHHTALAA